MSLTYEVRTSLTEVQCVCGMTYAIPTTLNQQLLDHRGKSVYCPSGHHWHYTGKSDAEKERDRRLRAEAALAQERDRHEITERQRRAAKGNLTKLKKRIEAGVCPHCQRTFSDVRAHMETKHADLLGTS